MEKPKIAIIGGGVSGAFLAFLLHKTAKTGHVHIFEKSRGLGGRCSSRRVENIGSVSLGAQFFTNKEDQLALFFDDLLDKKAIAPFPSPIGYQKSDGTFEAAIESDRFVGYPAMNSMIKYWSQNAIIHNHHRIQQITKKNNCWYLQAEGKQILENFDKVIVTLPYPQGIELWKRNTFLTLPTANMKPCWAAIFVTDDLPLEWQSAFLRNDLLSWYHSYLLPNQQRMWCVHSTSHWAIEQMDLSQEEAGFELFQALAKILGLQAQAKMMQAHFWRYASSEPMQNAQEAYYDKEQGIGYCADWLCGGRIEGAMLSAWKLSQQF